MSVKQIMHGNFIFEQVLAVTLVFQHVTFWILGNLFSFYCIYLYIYIYILIISRHILITLQIMESVT